MFFKKTNFDFIFLIFFDDHLIEILNKDIQIILKLINRFGRAPSSSKESIDICPEHRERVIDHKYGIIFFCFELP
jgi:hypothetical protein